MSGIFDLFNVTGNGIRQQSTSGSVDAMKKMSPKNVANFPIMSAKNGDVTRPKPKGLSIRPNSDLNARVNLNRERSPTKKSPNKQLAKPGNLRFGKYIKQTSPQRIEKNSKLQALKLEQIKASKIKSPHQVMPPEKMQTDTTVFKKPYTPKINKRPENIKVYPTPEKLAPYCDEADYFDLDREFVRLVKLSKEAVKPFEDEGFESDPEELEFVSPQLCDVLIESFEEKLTTNSPSLPSLSLDEDDELFD